MAEELWFVDPTAGSNKKREPLAPRPMQLAGKVVGLLDNTKEQGDIILSTVAQALKADFGVKEVVVERKQAFSKPASPQLIASLAARVDAVVTAIGG